MGRHEAWKREASGPQKALRDPSGCLLGKDRGVGPSCHLGTGGGGGPWLLPRLCSHLGPCKRQCPLPPPSSETIVRPRLAVGEKGGSRLIQPAEVTISHENRSPPFGVGAKLEARISLCHGKQAVSPFSRGSQGIPKRTLIQASRQNLGLHPTRSMARLVWLFPHDLRERTGGTVTS